MPEATWVDPSAGPNARSGRRRIALALAALGVLVAAALGWRLSGPAPLAPVSKVTLALPLQLNSGAAILADRQGLFTKAGVEVVMQTHQLGLNALKSLIDGKADLAIATDTPFVLSILAGQDLAVLASLPQSRRTMAIAARTDRGIDNVKDLDGKSVGVVMSSNFGYFLGAMLQVHGVAAEKVKTQDMKFDDVLAGLKDGTLDAAVVNHPALGRMQAAEPGKLKVFYGEDVYAFRYLLIGKAGYIDSHPQEAERVLRGLHAANRSIQAQPVQARQAISAALSVDDALMATFFDPTDYVLTLDQAMLLALDDEARWAMKRGLVKASPMPNFLNVIRLKPLEAVWPAAVKITH